MLRALKALLVVLVFLAPLGHVSAQTAGTVQGYVEERNPRGELEPRQGITVELTRLATGERRPPILTDPTGFYRFEGLAPGSYKLEFKEEGYTPLSYVFSLVLEVEPEVDVHAIIHDRKIGAAGIIWGVLVDEDGKSIENAKIKLSGVDVGLELEIRSVQGAGFSFKVPLGAYTLTIEHPDYEKWSRRVALNSHVGHDFGRITLSRPSFVAQNLALIAATIVVLTVVVALALYLKIKRRVARVPLVTPKPTSEGEEGPT